MGRIKSTKRHGLDFMGHGIWSFSYVAIDISKMRIITDI